MHPKVSQGLSRCGKRLGALVFVVREDEVLTAAVNVQQIAKVTHGHSRALDMPAGSSFAKRAWKPDIGIARRLPKHKIQRVAFLGLTSTLEPAISSSSSFWKEPKSGTERTRK